MFANKLMIVFAVLAAVAFFGMAQVEAKDCSYIQGWGEDVFDRCNSCCDGSFIWKGMRSHCVCVGSVTAAFGQTSFSK